MVANPSQGTQRQSVGEILRKKTNKQIFKKKQNNKVLAWGEHANSKRDSNWEPSGCEVAVVTTSPLCCPHIKNNSLNQML